MRHPHQVAETTLGGRVLACVALIALCGSAAQAQHIRPQMLADLPASAPTAIDHYGPAPQQFGVLRMPKGKGPFPVVVLIHGGCWTKGFADLRYMSPLADALRARGIATWNVEYRQLGEPGAGWPGTFQDWGAGVDRLADLSKAYALDLQRVIVVGHSAGAHGALWAARRSDLTTSSIVRGKTPLPVKAAIGIDGPPDVAAFIGDDSRICRKPTIAPFFGGTPAETPDHYEQGNPVQIRRTGAPRVFAIIASQVLSAAEAERVGADARRDGDEVEVVSIRQAGHFDMLDPRQPVGQLTVALIEQVFGLNPAEPVSAPAMPKTPRSP